MTRVFKTLFPGNHNPVATAFDKVLNRLNIQGQMKEFETFYLGLEADFEHFKEPGSKQDFVRAIYDAFFRGADKKAATKHGIVHTPVEIVDFILDSVQYALQSEFGKSLDDRRVKVLDPFTGTGIFLAQLLERGMISSDSIRDKYLHDIYANEIMLPAFYVAAANIETAYQKVAGEYLPFEGISYMDTFDQHPSYRLESRYRERQSSLVDTDLKEASERVRHQGMEDINVITGNPPYSAGQKSANDDNQNVSHPELEGLVKDTYIKHAPKGNQVSLYNSYLKALRWASDRIGESGIIGFIMPSAWITGNAEAGVRACLYEEFTDVYCFDLLGQKGIPDHGRNIFEYRGTGEGGTTVSTSIVILVKNPSRVGCSIRYASLSKAEYEGEQKRSKVKELKDISHVPWETISPDKYHDWLNQRGELADEWEDITPIGSKDGKRGKTSSVIFGTYSRGLATSRDDWAYNTSKEELTKNMKRHIDYCNKQDPDNFIIEPKQAKWNTELTTELRKLRKQNTSPALNESRIRKALFRPFFKQNLYFDPVFIAATYQIPKFFPRGDVKNPSIMVSDKSGDFSTFIADKTPDLNNLPPNQVFPLKTKKQNRENVRQVASPQSPVSSLQSPVSTVSSLHSLQSPVSSLQSPVSSLQSPQSPVSSTESVNNCTRQDQGRVLGLHNEYDAGSTHTRDGPGIPDEGDGEMIDNITDWALNLYRTTYKDNTITKEDIFYYTYGILHSPGFREKYQMFLVRGIPNIPMAPDFRAFCTAGRELAQLHLNFDSDDAPRYDLGEPLHVIPNAPKNIKFGEKKRDGPGPKTTFDNTKLLLDGILVYDNLPHTNYKVNGLTPIGWFVSRYVHSDHLSAAAKKGWVQSGNANYPLEDVPGDEVRAIIERLVYIGVQSGKIIADLPEEFEGMAAMQDGPKQQTMDGF